MPALDFKDKQHIYAHHMTVPYRSLVPNMERSLNSGGADDNLIYADSPYSIILKRHVLYGR